MDCVEARRLLDQGITPGAHTPQSSQLGFHLARCAACRAHHTRNDSLLAALLFDAPAALPLRESKSGSSTSMGTATRRLSTRPAVRQIVRMSGFLMGIVGLALLVWLGGILLRTLENVAAMTTSSTAAPQTSREDLQPSSQNGVLSAAAPLIANKTVTPRSATATRLPSPTVSATALASATVQTSIPATRSGAGLATPTAIASPSFINLTTGVPTPQSASQSPAVHAASGTPQTAPPAGEAVTILILGNDRRPDEQAVPRTDAIMLARINPQSGRIALLSLPRDLWVPIPGYGASRINAAYVWGEIYHADGGGLGLAKATLSELTSVPIDYVVMADFQGFMGAIDSIGGITVDVDKPLDDPQFPTLDYGYTHAHFDAGPQHMDGLTALTYSRIRHPDSDFARIKRQQAVILGLGERLRERGDLENLLQADTITGALRAYVHSDIPQDRLLGLVWALRAIDSSTVERFSLGPDMISFGIGNDRYAELLVPGAIETLVRQWYGQ